MKFIWYLLALAASAAAFIFYYTKTNHPVEKDIVVTINQKHITREEFNARRASVHNSDRQDFINSLIVKELMIQDAQKEGIDKQETFRRSIQNYYEQSLIKQVMDKKINSLKVNVTDEEINHHASFQNSTLQVTIFSAADEDAAKKGQFKAQETRTLRANDLAGDVGERLEALKEGAQTSPLCSDAGCDVYRLDKVASPPREAITAERRRNISSRLAERKRQKAMDSWIADLRAKSDIRISIK